MSYSAHACQIEKLKEKEKEKERKRDDFKTIHTKFTATGCKLSQIMIFIF